MTVNLFYLILSLTLVDFTPVDSADLTWRYTTHADTYPSVDLSFHNPYCLVSVINNKQICFIINNLNDKT